MKVSADTLELVAQNQKSDTKKSSDTQSTGFRKTDQIGITYGVNRSSSDIGLYDMTQSTSISDIQSMAENADMKTIKDSMGLMSNTVSSTDVKDMLEQGYQYGDMEVDSIVTVTDKIKINLAAHCDDYKAYGDSVDASEAESVTGSTTLAYQVAKKFKEEDLPVTDENVSDSVNAVTMAQSITNLSDGAIKYMVTNDITPTIENTYRAEYSADASGNGGSYGIGYFTEGTGYYGKTSSDYNWSDLQGQMSKVVEGAGLDVTDENMQDAQWLVKNNVPLTTDTLTSYQDLKNLTLPVDTDTALQSITNALQDGKRPSEALLTQNTSIYTRAQNACEVVQNTTDENLKTLISNNQEINIANLSAVQNETSVEAGSSGTESTQSGTSSTQTVSTSATSTSSTGTSGTITIAEDNVVLVTARRQLEEIRLQMSAEANVRLLKQGISIETESISNLVDSLKQAEQSLLKDTFSSAGVEASDENVSLYTETLSKVSALKSMPSYVLGSVATGETESTVDGVYTSGSTLKTQLDKASQSYETLMTQPRKDMGDSIKKAFQNVDDILNDMGLETTEANQRAVRILGYNSMEITEDNVQTVKEADESVNQLIKNMTPTVALTLIRNGKNPLNTNIDELNQEISDIQETQSTTNSETKYSEFLYNLEQNNSITEQERSTYIGIYRLLNNVEKSDGGAVGALVNQNADITLNNLLSAVRTSKSKGMDVTIDENFGGLENLTYSSTRISDQLETSFGGSTSTDSDKKNQTTYYQNLTSKALDQVTPSKLQSMFPDGQISDMSLEQFAESLSALQNNSTEDNAYAEAQQEVFKQASTTEDSVISVLQKYDQPITINTLLASSGMLSSKGSVYKKLDAVTENCDEETKTNYETATASLSESLTSKEEMQTAVAGVQTASNEVLNQASQEPDISSLDLNEIRLMRKEIQLSTNLANEERYQIPVQINGELTAINLTISHGEEESGQVTITMENDSLGKVAANFTVKDNTVEGYVATDNSQATETLKNNSNVLAEQLEQSGLSLQSVQYIKTNNLDLIKFEEKNLLEKESTEDGASDTSSTTDTKSCYLAAKAFVSAIKSFS